ncbi:MAG: fumarate hydratase, partial [Clostridia bacterium]|nr:fumarate hydratase [Clostridia bacterium]
GIGPQGMGGTTTALAVNIEEYPTHIAGLPVAVNINCHAPSLQPYQTIYRKDILPY